MAVLIARGLSTSSYVYAPRHHSWWRRRRREGFISNFKGSSDFCGLFITGSLDYSLALEVTRRRLASKAPQPLPLAPIRTLSASAGTVSLRGAMGSNGEEAGGGGGSMEVKLKAIEATAETFAEFGQVIEASPDGEEFGPRDALLDLSRGVPRFYIMRLENRPLGFSTITHHASVTQCLGAIGGHVWYLGVAKPSIVSSSSVVKDDHTDKNVKKSHSGHLFVPPAVNDVRVFRIAGSKFVKLNHGTWHAGPLFRADAMDFYNLELSNTNVVDHTTHNFRKDDGVFFSIYD